MLPTSLLLFGLAVAGQVGEPTATVVVHGYSARVVKERVRQCLARGCGPFEFANDVLAAANTAFVAGDYDTARGLLDEAVRHLDKVAGPVKARVAIFTAQSLVAEHQGDRRDALGAYTRAVYALHRAGPAAQWSEVLTRIDLADLLARTNKDLEARRAFKNAAAIADKTGSDDLRAAVSIHMAVLDYRSGASRQATARLHAIINSPRALGAGTRLAAATIFARIARQSGDMKPTEALLARSALQPAGDEPALVYSPAIEQPRDDPDGVFALKVEGKGPLEWADIGYWIRPSGRVDDVEVLRGSHERAWLRPIEVAIGRRVYMATIGAADTKGGYYMVERVTLGFPKVVPIGSLIGRRVGTPSITELKLARQDAPPPPAGARETSK